jgi:hypothetical protein
MRFFRYLFLTVALSAVAWPQCFTIANGRAQTSRILSGDAPNSQNSVEAFLLAETERLNSAMGQNARLFMVPDANAYANPEDMNVYFGRALIAQLQGKLGGQNTQAAVRIVLAHEFAHLFQFTLWKSGRAQAPSSTPSAETQADTIAGMWVGFDMAGPGADINGVIAAQDTAAAVGDVQWTSPDHHGHPLTRRTCMLDGLQAGQTQRVGSRTSAYKQRAAEIYTWSAQVAAQALSRDKNPRVFQF